MDFLTHSVLAVASKPATSLSISLSATVLGWIGFLTPLLTFLSLAIGLVAGIYALVHQRNLVKKDNAEK